MRKRIIICGGGAAGFFTAINVAEKNPQALVTILEKSSKVLSKVRISGGGRCNVTNGRISPSELVKFYPRGGKKLYALLKNFSTQDMRNWLDQRYVPTHIESDLRVFPTTNSSDTIIQCFMHEIKRLNVDLHLSEGVIKIIRENDSWHIDTTTGKTYTCDILIMAAGSSPSVWKLLADMGIEIIPPVPSLFTFNIESPLLRGMQGISFSNIEARIAGTTLKEHGPMLVTHWGLSGPAILKLSAWGARELAAMNYHFQLLVNFIPEYNPETCKRGILDYQKSNPKRKVVRYPLYDIPRRFWEQICLTAEVKESLLYGDLGNKLINKLTHYLTQAEFSVTGKSTFKEEFVTSGGVALSEINLNTFASKKFPGLYLCGEMVDIDALTGGFNFQACWSSAWAISQNL
jgi:predicted Rossmann fold flavoprotein